MNADVYFESEKRLQEFLDLVEPYSRGGEVIAYLYYGRMLKLFAPALEGERIYTKEEVFGLSKIEAPSFIFPQNGVYFDGQLIGYLSKFIRGLQVDFANIKYVPFPTFIKALTIYCDDLQTLSNHFVVAKDTYYTNLILSRDHLYNIDTMEFEQVDKPIEEIKKTNVDDLARAIYPCVVNKRLKKFVKNNSELDQFYQSKQFQYSIIEFLQKMQNTLSEYAGKEIQTLDEGCKILKR